MDICRWMTLIIRWCCSAKDNSYRCLSWIVGNTTPCAVAEEEVAHREVAEKIVRFMRVSYVWTINIHAACNLLIARSLILILTFVRLENGINRLQSTKGIVLSNLDIVLIVNTRCWINIVYWSILYEQVNTIVIVRIKLLAVWTTIRNNITVGIMIQINRILNSLWLFWICRFVNTLYNQHSWSSRVVRHGVENHCWRCFIPCGSRTGESAVSWSIASKINATT